METMKALIYCRKSSEDKNKQTLSLQDQINECKKIADREHLVVTIPPFVEAKTGWEAEVRVEFYKMLELIKKGKANAIICWNLDRIGRNGQENGIVRDLLSKGKLKIYTAYKTYESEDSLLAGVENLMNEQFSLKLSSVVKRALRGKVERGIYPNRVPLGYLNTPYKLKGQRIILTDKKRWLLCRRWWDLMLSGTHTVPTSLAEITRLGLVGKTGRKISRTNAFNFFNNIFYTGNFKYGGEIHNGTHKPMITMVEYNKVQAILASKGRTGAFTANVDLPYMGMLKCAECGSTITAERHIKKYVNGTSQTFYYYRCTKKRGDCSQKYLNEKEVEPQIENFISRLELHPAFSEWFKKVIKRRNQAEFNFSIKQRELLTKRLNDIDREKLNYYGMKVDGMVTEEKYKEKKNELLKEEAEITEQLTAGTTKYWEGVIDQAIDFASNATTMFKNGDPYCKKLILKILGSNLLLNNKKIEIEAKTQFVFLRDTQNELLGENVMLEPENITNIGANLAFMKLENSTVPSTGLYSNFLNLFNDTKKEAHILANQLDELYKYQYATLS